LGLGKIFIFSVFSGISFAFSYRTSGDASDVGFAFVFLNQISQAADEQMQALVLILSIIVTVFFIYSLARFMRQVYDQRLAGIVTAILGFTGSFLVLSSQEQSEFVVLGFSLWIAGIVIIILGKKYKKNV
jgi:hypothetical protein